jgi:acylphosphatase
MIARRLRVRGRVQGVGYRYATIATAARLGLDGWVRNCLDGTVEVVAQGEPEAVASLVAWCRGGPPGAGVTSVEVIEVDADAAVKGFGVRATAPSGSDR